ncbi:MAG: DUF1499 domain-containing protein [Gemmataceae bacterium]|nr:DUF1499 domain-containing protein [Gemmataceae bacterium]
MALLLVGLAPVVCLAVLSVMSQQRPPLGVRGGRLAPCPRSPNCVSTQADDPDHAIAPLRFTGSADEARRRLRRALARLPRLTVVTETENYLHVEARSALFRFVDDVEFLIDPEAGLIHFRSASRVGWSDLGVNRRRMEQVRAAFVAEAMTPAE